MPHERVFKMDFENLVCKDESFIAFNVVIFAIVDNVASNRRLKI